MDVNYEVLASNISFLGLLLRSIHEQGLIFYSFVGIIGTKGSLKTVPSLACSKLAVSGDDRKAGGRRAGSGEEKGDPARLPPAFSGDRPH